jgi:hypothetical protein
VNERKHCKNLHNVEQDKFFLDMITKPQDKKKNRKIDKLNLIRILKFNAPNDNINKAKRQLI